jgi:hypothetical protein
MRGHHLHRVLEVMKTRTILLNNDDSTCETRITGIYRTKTCV